MFVVGISRAFPMTGSPGGPGGKGRLDFLRRRKIEYAKISIAQNQRNMAGCVSGVRRRHGLWPSAYVCSLERHRPLQTERTEVTRAANIGAAAE